jgi:hypothetical protein
LIVPWDGWCLAGSVWQHRPSSISSRLRGG